MILREIVLDIETTGFKIGADRIIEVAAVELVNHRPTGHEFHTHVNPMRRIEADSIAIHGLTEEFLADKPRFKDVADDLVQFIRDSSVVAHNGVAFDIPFINFELANSGRPVLANQIIDTMKLARKQRPGQRSSLDALVKYYDIKNTRVDGTHGALIDCHLLVQVYRKLSGFDQQAAMQLTPAPARPAAEPGTIAEAMHKAQRALMVVMPTEEELGAHRRMLKDFRIEHFPGDVESPNGSET